MQGQGRQRQAMGGRGGAAGGFQYRQGPAYNVWADQYQPAYAHQAPHHVQPLVAPGYGRAVAQRGLVAMGVQGAGILKRPVGPPQGPLLYGRGHARGHRGRAWGGRGRDRDRDRKNLTKEALDADLDEWRLKDKKFGGQSLDADLDDYWKNKEESEPGKLDGDDSLEITQTAEASEPPKQEVANEVKAVIKKSNGAHIDRQSNGDKERAVNLRAEAPTKGG